MKETRKCVSKCPGPYDKNKVCLDGCLSNQRFING